MIKVLLLEGHTIETLPVLKSLKDKGCQITIICDTKQSYGYHSRYADYKILKKLDYTKPETREYILGILKAENYDFVMPLYDPSAGFVSANKELISKYTNAATPDFDVFSNGFEKNKLMQLCFENNLPHPKTCEIGNEPDIAAKRVGFPALIKPNITSGGRGMVLVNNIDDMKEKLPGIINDFGDCTLQEYIPFGGRQFKVQLFRTKTGKICQTTVMEKYRFYPENGGSSCCNSTIENPALVNLTKKILDILQWEGFADFDLIEDPRDHIIKVMEINPRFPACIKASFISGVDFAEIYMDYALGKDLKQYEYKPGKHLRYLGIDLLWFMHSKERFKSKPSWFRLFGKDIYYQDGSFDDIKPFVMGTFGKIALLMDPKFRGSKSGLRT